MPIRSFALPVVVLVLIGTVVWLGWEARAVAEVAGRAEVEARRARAAAVAAGAERDAEAAAHRATAAELDAAVQAVGRLEAEVATTAAQLGEMGKALAAAKAMAEERVAAAHEADRAAIAAMPEGVRLCLRALHECMHAEGYGAVRFLRARELDGDGLHDVEVVHTHADGLGADLIVAGTMTAALDLGAQRLVFTFFEGTRTELGERVPLPDNGYELVFEPVDGRLLGERVPQLVQVSGVHPSALAADRTRQPGALDVATRLAWLERFDRLLEAAGTADRVRLQELRGVKDGEFLDGYLLATDDKGHVQYGATCARLAVEVDRHANVVSLVLRDGILHRGLAESTITADGYRILLPKLRPERAAELMLGMVVEKQRGKPPHNNQ